MGNLKVFDSVVDITNIYESVSLNFEEFRIFTADDENSIWLKLGQKVLDRIGF